MKQVFVAAIAIAVLQGICIAVAEADEATPIKEFDDPDGKSTATATASRLVLEAGDADAKATVRVAHSFKTKTQDRYARYSLTVTAPFDSKKADKVDVGTLSGLTSGTSAALEFGLLHWSSSAPSVDKALTDKCVEVIPLLIPNYDWTTVSALGPPKFNCDEAILDPANLKKTVELINETRKKCAKCVQVEKAPPPRCQMLKDANQQACAATTKDVIPDSQVKMQAALCALLESERRETCQDCEAADPRQIAKCNMVATRPEASVAGNAADIIKQVKDEVVALASKIQQPMYGLTLGLKANTQDFKYVLETAPTAKPNSTSKTGTGISLAYTRVGLKTLLTAGYSHEESYKASDKVQVCSPIGTTGSTSCSEAVIGAPGKKKSELAFFEGRRIISAAHFAVAPRFEYDFKDSEWAVRVPLYFIANKKHELTAGVTVGYSDADDDEGGYGVTVFVSKAFAFFD